MVCTTCGDVIFYGGPGCACVRAARHKQEEAEIERIREELNTPEMAAKFNALVEKAKARADAFPLLPEDEVTITPMTNRREDDDVEGHPV